MMWGSRFFRLRFGAYGLGAVPGLRVQPFASVGLSATGICQKMNVEENKTGTFPYRNGMS